MKKISLTEVEVSHLREVYQAELEFAKKRIAALTGVLSKLGELKDSDEKEVNQLLEGKIVVKKIEKKGIKKPGKRGRPAKVKSAPTIAEKAIEPAKTKTQKLKPALSKTAKAKVAKTKQPKPAKVPKATKIVKPVKPAKPAKAIKIAKTASTEAPAKVVAKKKVKSKKTKTVRKPIKKAKGGNKIKWNEFVIDLLKNNNNFLHSNIITKEAGIKFNISESDMDRVRMVIAGALTKLVNTDKKLVTYKKPGVRGSLYGLPEWISASGDIVPEIKEKMLAN